MYEPSEVGRATPPNLTIESEIAVTMEKRMWGAAPLFAGRRMLQSRPERRLAFALFALATLVGLALAIPANAGVKPQQQIAGVKLGMTKANVRAQLGRPLATYSHSRYTRLYYLKVRVTVHSRAGVIEVETTSKAQRTRAGIGIGSTEREVRKEVARVSCRPYRSFLRLCRVGTAAPRTRATEFLLFRNKVISLTIVVTPDKSAPITPTDLAVTGTTPTGVSLAWSASRDDVKVVSYRVYRSGRQIAATPTTSTTIGGLACGATYTFRIDAEDSWGNRSPTAAVSAATNPCPSDGTATERNPAGSDPAGPTGAAGGSHPAVPPTAGPPAAGQGGRPSACSFVSQYNITFQFDKEYPCGRFVNGDWWVIPGKGDTSVRITRITPDFAGGRNGWQVNPTTFSQIGYDSRIGGYSSALVPSLPYKAAPGSSIIKGISSPACGGSTSPAHYPCLLTASVLTVLARIPPGNGAQVFRPSYAGTRKRLFTTAQLQTHKLRRLPTVPNAPTLRQVRERYARVQLDHRTAAAARYMHPAYNFFRFGVPFPASSADTSAYGSDLASDNTDAALRLMLAESVKKKMPALVNYVQAGIDWYGARRIGRWSADGGHGLGRKLPIAFAAVLLGDADMAATAATTSFSEVLHISFSPRAGKPGTVYFRNTDRPGMPLFGKVCARGAYEKNVATHDGARDCKDPTAYTDGGQEPGGSYQFCCTSKPFKGTSLAVRLMPGVRTAFGYEPFHQYVDRWVDFGAWTQPDPQNRYPGLHGTRANGGYYGSAFQNNMWKSYRSLIGNTFCGPGGC